MSKRGREGRYTVRHTVSVKEDVRTFSMKGPAFAFAKRHAPQSRVPVEVMQMRWTGRAWISQQCWFVYSDGRVMITVMEAA